MLNFSSVFGLFKFFHFSQKIEKFLKTSFLASRLDFAGNSFLVKTVTVLSCSFKKVDNVYLVFLKKKYLKKLYLFLEKLDFFQN